MLKMIVFAKMEIVRFCEQYLNFIFKKDTRLNVMQCIHI